MKWLSDFKREFLKCNRRVDSGFHAVLQIACVLGLWPSIVHRISGCFAVCEFFLPPTDLLGAKRASSEFGMLVFPFVRA